MHFEIASTGPPPAGAPPAPAQACARFDLSAIGRALVALQAAFPDVNLRLHERHDPLDYEVVNPILAGYAYVDRLIADGVDAFAMGSLRHLCEMNHLVLCGTDPARRGAHRALLAATEAHFYDQREGGIRDVVEWHERLRDGPVWRLAAGVCVRMMSAPQLFLEGNHRTAVLVASYILARAGKPPFVLTAENAPAFFVAFGRISAIEKRSLLMRLRMPRLISHLAGLFEAECDPAFLLPRHRGLNPGP